MNDVRVLKLKLDGKADFTGHGQKTVDECLAPGRGRRRLTALPSKSLKFWQDVLPAGKELGERATGNRQRG
jgi:hypothetical protein